MFIFTVALVYVFQLASFLASIPRLAEMYRFYTHLLGVPDVSDILLHEQTVGRQGRGTEAEERRNGEIKEEGKTCVR